MRHGIVLGGDQVSHIESERMPQIEALETLACGAAVVSLVGLVVRLKGHSTPLSRALFVLSTALITIASSYVFTTILSFHPVLAGFYCGLIHMALFAIVLDTEPDGGCK